MSMAVHGVHVNGAQTAADTSASVDDAVNSETEADDWTDLEIRVRGHSRSLKVVPFDRVDMVSY